MAKNKIEIEKRLSILYFIVSSCGLISSILMAIIWNYWKYTLNTCIDFNCGCLLYATTTYNTFSGAVISICRFVTFAPIFSLIWGVLIGSYHAYRVCILKQHNRGNRRPTVTFHSPEEARVDQAQRKSPLYICLFVMSLSFVLLFFSIAIIMTDGYYTACKGYKKAVIKHLSANGNLAAMVYDRMTCGTIFDFLDYIQPDPTFLETRFRRGTLIINTGILLQVSIITSWLSLACWIIISYCNALSIFNKERKIFCFKK
ncbi:uncharacterized protein LOC142322318 isoform X2 [Lycorma delicatula]|uniref:uncharacterized protein LOC142322318 isoform X2 n=1 Tax=Lycorma delicatula TaxID=130591 RepID=UPI003F5113EF